VICPSPYESLSIVLLEALALGTPALASARSPVLVDHCRRSNGGLYYQDADEFGEALDLLAREPRLRAALGQAGRAYVRENYRWEAVLGRYRSLIEAVSRS
jgi:glycosyltransferase involved in cell wall biosynthesis